MYRAVSRQVRRRNWLNGKLQSSPLTIGYIQPKGELPQPSRPAILGTRWEAIIAKTGRRWSGRGYKWSIRPREIAGVRNL